MHRIAVFAAILALLGSNLPPSFAQGASQAPHAWLFGTWTGGLFPPASGVNAQTCLGAPVVIFTRDVVLRATLTDLTFSQRDIETVRGEAGQMDIRFTTNASPAPGGLLGLTAPPAPLGFGCESPDVLHVQRKGENEISFPGCADFPYPLLRCPAR